MPIEIKFGTDGWRAGIGDGFTFENVRRVAQATCDVIRKASKSRLVLVGYDRRFFSDRFADTAARVAVANGFRVELSAAPISSPTLSFHVKSRKAAMGFMITASHNPYYFNGFKLKGPHGGSVNETVTQSVQDRVDAGDIQYGDETAKKVNFADAYIASLKKYVALQKASGLKGTVVFDAMYGPGGVLFEKLLGGRGKFQFIRKETDPLFGGVNPEPIETNLAALKEAVAAHKAIIGIAVDGDADRIGVVDDRGRYLAPHMVMPLILLHLIENRKLKGKIIQTVSMGYLTERIAKHYGLEFEQVPVGFKHIAKKMETEKVLFGGEESGGYGIGLWSPERDGLLCALLLLELLAVKKRPLSALVDDVTTRFGTSLFKRVDFPLKSTLNKTEWTERMIANLSQSIGGKAVKNTNPMDGLKVTMDDDSWLLMRPSGTEPLLRTYSEGTSAAIVQSLLAEAQRLASLPPPSTKKSAAEKAKAKAKKKLAAARS